jgi:tyrosine-protein phosphatase YwqE
MIERDNMTTDLQEKMTSVRQSMVEEATNEYSSLINKGKAARERQKVIAEKIEQVCDIEKFLEVFGEEDPLEFAIAQFAERQGSKGFTMQELFKELKAKKDKDQKKIQVAAGSLIQENRIKETDKERDSQVIYCWSE